MSANMQMMEDSVHFLSKETVVQAIARSATKVLFLIIDFFFRSSRSISSGPKLFIPLC